jgi:hypothetical protein
VSDVFEEVEEGLRQDQFSTFIKKYGVLLAAGFVAILLGIGGYQGFAAWQVNQSRDFATKLDQAQQLVGAHKGGEAEKALTDLIGRAPPGYKTAALLQLAAVKLDKGDKAGALKAYEDAAKASPTQQFRDIAQLKAAYVAADIEDFPKLEARVKPMLDKAGPFSFQARELLAMQAYANGDAARAREELEFLTLALDAPEGVRQRAQGLLSALGPAPASAEPAGAPKAPPANTGDKK